LKKLTNTFNKFFYKRCKRLLHLWYEAQRK